jgi:hypothetical protein
MLETSPPPASFDDLLLVELKAWNWNLHVGLCSDLTPPDQRFQGGLSYIRSFEIQGLIRAPSTLRSKAIRIWTLPFGPELRFGPDDDVGQVYFRSPTGKHGELSATLHVPEGAISTMATCLGSVWKYLRIRTFDPDQERASIAAFSFSSDIDDNLLPRVGANDQEQ